MAHHEATVTWTLKDGEDFKSGKYSRGHVWRFDGGHVAPGSPAPSVVPAPLSDPAGVDPEEAFVASLSSCHMLFFLFHAQRAGFSLKSYTDAARGELGKLADGRRAMVRVELRPTLVWDGAAPDSAAIAAMHDKAHHDCFIANSVTTEVVVLDPAHA